jgi:copper chaperone
MPEVILRIDGMHCGSCIRRVTQSLQSVTGAEAEEVRLGAARVQMDEGADPKLLVAALAKAGFAAHQEA